MHDIVLIRHGRSLADDEKKHEGRYDSPLTNIGKKQAIDTTEELFTIFKHFDSIIHSPLLRAKETAEIINKKFNTELCEDELLLEMDNGILAGLPFFITKEKYPKKKHKAITERSPENSGENILELHSRAILALNSILSRNAGKYLIVSHGGILNTILRIIFNQPFPVDENRIGWKFGDNGWLHIKFETEKNKWTVVQFKGK